MFSFQATVAKNSRNGLKAPQQAINSPSSPRGSNNTNLKQRRSKPLTKTFIHGNPDEGVAKALSAPELSTFQKNFIQISQTSSPLAPILSVYGGYPFTPQSLPLSQDSLLRA